MITVSELRSNIGRYRWGSKIKSYEGDLQYLTSLYWHVVAHDIILEGKNTKGSFDYESLLTRFERSYGSIFFWNNRLYYSLLEKFEGLNFYRLNEEEKTWESWKKETEATQNKILREILDKILYATSNERYMIKNHNPGDLAFDWRKLNSYHQNKPGDISSYLSLHLNDGTFYYEDVNSTNIYFIYSLKKHFIDMLHKDAFVLYKTRILLSIFDELDKRKREFDNSEDSQKRGMPKIHPYKKMAIPDAIECIESKNPAIKDLKLSHIKHLILTHFRDLDGKEFKNKSVYKALHRKGYKN